MINNRSYFGVGFNRLAVNQLQNAANTFYFLNDFRNVLLVFERNKNRLSFGLFFVVQRNLAFFFLAGA